MSGGALADVSFFAGLPQDELDEVSHAATEVEFPAGKQIVTEGDLGHCLFVILAGKAIVTSDDESRGEVGPGDVIGEIAVLSSGRRTATVVAKTPLRALKWFKRDVWALEASAPDAARRLREALDGHRA